ncbi:MAG: SPOR domain-containing protein [Oceanospirillaceae bacterium]|nr:AAA family ATPase [Oceanospirillaceae bacterium]MDO7584737.1 SPOR domain-containing protein [Oceanospirillaceae bacterium]HAW16973.1 hypothetical protein [Oceanospirillaceae bacterium]
MSSSVHKLPTAGNLDLAYSAYVDQLNQQEETSQSTNLEAFEYQAKARSRQLDTLLHLSHFSDYLVLISAPSGAGKTTFIEQFLRVQPADACIVHLVLDEWVTAPWVVRQLAQQLPLQIPDHASLEESILAIQELAQELTLQKEVLLVVVDNAQCLDEDALELLANLLPRSAKVDSRPHVILCADHSVVERIEAPQFAELRQERFYHLVLAPFSQEESADYLRQRLQLIGISHSLAPIQLLQLHQLAKGNPGYLNMLVNKALNKGSFGQQSGLPWLHIATTTIVVAVLASIWLMNDEPTKLVLQNEVDVQPVIEALEASQKESREGGLEEGPIAQALPPLEPIELSLAPQNVSLEPKIESVQKPLLEPDVEVTITPDNKPKLDPPTPIASPAQTEAVISRPELEVWPSATSTTKQPYSFAALLELPSNHYSLQILGARLETTIEAFVKGRKFTQPYYILQLERGGKPWFMLLVGNYASSKDAKSAISSLPAALQNQKPWARPVSKIQQQIRNKFNTSGE